MIVGLPELKGHLRTDPNSTHEDALIAAYAEAAEQQIINWIGRPVYATEAELPAIGAPGYDPEQIVAPAAVRVAVLMMTDRFYTNRGAATSVTHGGDGVSSDDAVPPPGVRALLAGLRVYSRPPVPAGDLRTGDPLTWL
ncbi:head-tail connector protein [Paracoccus sp. S4493]|uniref:head-tail connector protein n=1 Tax=Paracoccus sp. S4493 TaxID=579490 RepID=UPI000698F662|nr:head-tail connector protein [Paracoccus sp. S4493]